MKYKVITTFRPSDWDKYAKRMVQSVLDKWPNADITVYYQDQKPDFNQNVTWVDIDNANPKLHEFREKYKNDPVAVGKLNEIPGGVRRSPRLATEGGLDAKKESYLWNAVKFSYKVSCVTHAVKTYKDYDYVIWIDDDTYTFRPMPIEFLENILPINTMLTYLGRERFELNDGGKYPECGFVGYNLRHPEIQNFVKDWEQLYVTDNVFKLLEWHDSFVFWHLSKLFRKEKNIEVNDIGYAKGVEGHHVFVNSELGLYIDHFKGDRKQQGTSAKKDLRSPQADAPADVSKIDYWKNVPPT